MTLGTHGTHSPPYARVVGQTSRACVADDVCSMCSMCCPDVPPALDRVRLDPCALWRAKGGKRRSLRLGERLAARELSLSSALQNHRAQGTGKNEWHTPAECSEGAENTRVSPRSGQVLGMAPSYGGSWQALTGSGLSLEGLSAP